MLSKQDLDQISLRGISEETVLRQLEQIKNGFPFLKIDSAAAVGHGIVSPDENERERYVAEWK